MTEQGEELNYEQLVTLWNIAGKPTDAPSLAPMLNSATPQAEKRFLTKAKVGLIESLVEETTLLSARTCTILARDRRPTVRRTVAQCPLPISVLRELSTDSDVSTRCWVAKSTDTPLDVLAQLSQDSSMSVLQTVAGNTNTPTAVLDAIADMMLSKLGTGFDNVSVSAFREYDVLVNVVANSNQTNQATLVRIGEYAQINEQPRHWDWRGSSLINALSANPSTPIDTLIDLLDSFPRSKASRYIIDEISPKRSHSDRAMIARNPSVYADDIAKLFLWNTSPQVRASVAHNPNITIDQLRTLADDPDPAVRDEVEKVLEGLAAVHNELGNKRGVKSPPRTYVPHEYDAEQFFVMVDNSRPWSARNLLIKSNPQANLEQLLAFGINAEIGDAEYSELLRLYRDSENIYDYYLLIQDLRASSEFLLHASRIANASELYELLVQHPNTPSEALAEIAKSDDADVLLLVAEHPNTTGETLDLLAEDKNPEVRRVLPVHANVLERTAAKLATDTSWDVRSQVAAVVAEEPLVRSLLLDSHPRVAAIAEARLDETSAERLSMLAMSADARVRIWVAANPNTDPETLALLAQDANVSVRGQVALNPHTTQETLANLAGDEYWFIRCAVVENPYTPIEILEVLHRDKSADVREQAQKTLDARS